MSLLPLLPWIALLLLINVTQRDALSLEIAFIGSGFLALLFGAAQPLTLLPLQGNYYLMLHRTLFLFLILAPLDIALPWWIVPLLGAGALGYLLPYCYRALYRMH